MGEIIDIRRAKGRLDARRREGSEGSPDRDDRRRRRLDKKSERKAAVRMLLRFCPQIKIGGHFKVILGTESAVEPTHDSAGQRVIESTGKGFKVSEHIFRERPPGQLRAREGDLLLSITRAARPFATLEAALGALKEKRDETDNAMCISAPIRKVNTDLTGCVLGRNVVALRPLSHSVYADVFLRFFEDTGGFWSPGYASEWLGEMTRARSRRKLAGLLGELHVPIVPNDLIETIRQTDDMLLECSVHPADRADPDKYLLESDSRDELDRRLLALQTENYALQQAFNASSDPAYQIRNFYPFPLALPYRSLTGLIRPHDLLREQLRVAENVLVLVASLGLALSNPPPSPVIEAFDARRSFSAGDWLEIGNKSAAMLEAVAHGDLPNALKLLWRGKFMKQAARLVKIRNDYYHQRIDTSRFRDTTEELRKLLADCFSQMAFLVRFPMFRVCDVKVDRRSGKAVHTVQKYVGDHPAHEQGSYEFDRALPEGLYIQTEEGPKDLFPFITIRECSTCSVPETYFLDRLGKDSRRWSVKSFERSHPQEAGDVAEALSKWRGESGTPA